MSGPKGHVHTFHNEMAPILLKPTYTNQQFIWIFIGSPNNDFSPILPKDIRVTRSISELTGLSCTRLFMVLQRKNSEEINEEFCAAKRRDNHTQFTWLELSGPKGHVHTFHNEMAPILLKPTYTELKRWGDIGKLFQSTSCRKMRYFSESYRVGKMHGRSKTVPHDTRLHIYNGALFCGSWLGTVWVI